MFSMKDYLNSGKYKAARVVNTYKMQLLTSFLYLNLIHLRVPNTEILIDLYIER